MVKLRNPLDAFENKVGGALEGAGDAIFKSSLSPVKISKAAEKEMHREKLVGVGKISAPTLYTVMISEEDDAHLRSYFPSLMGEVETYIVTKAGESGYTLECKPLVRFIAESKLKKGKFVVIAENVAPNTLEQLRTEEYEFLGIQAPAAGANQYASSGNANRFANAGAQAAASNASYAPQVGASAAAYAAGYAGVANPQAPVDQTRMFNNEAPRQNMRQNANAKRDAGYGYLDYPSTGERFILNSVTEIGRDSGAQIPIPNRSVSRVHARIECAGNAVYLHDLGSMNGTFVNGQMISRVELHNGDVVQFGTEQFRYGRDY